MALYSWGASTFTVDTITYTITSSVSSYTVRLTLTSRSENVIIPSSVTYSGIEYSVTSIGHVELTTSGYYSVGYVLVPV